MKILFLPIDIDMSNLNFQQKEGATKAGSFMQFWDASFISNEVSVQTGLNVVLEQLPFTRITRLFHKIQSVEVPKHVDVHSKMLMEPGEFDHIKQMEPAGYRMVLKGQNDSLSIHDGKKWIDVILPNAPCCYLINSTVGYHKVKRDPGRETIYVRGYLNEIKHKELIERSLVKFKEYAIYDENL